MNSNFAAARLAEQRGGATPVAAGSFARVLRSTPAAGAVIEAEPAETGDADSTAPSRSRTSQPPPADPPEFSPEAPPVRSRTAQTEAAPPEPTRRSSVPHFLSVPESVQFPNGPYRQAPAEHGGEWWLTNPFTGLEPWVTQGFGDPYAAPPPASDPEGSPEFLAVFGPRPTRQTHPNPMLRGAAVADWERNREHFKGVGLPDEFTQEQLDTAGALFESWGLGRPLLYEGRYGWTAKFPSAGVPDFEASPFAALTAPHLVVARYQIEMTAQGAEPPVRHPFVPPYVFEPGALNA